MSRKATTFRIDPPVRSALETLSKVLECPMNQLVNEALTEYVRRRSRSVEQDLEATLATLRAHRERDPDFDSAIDRIAEAEAGSEKEDPAQGEVVTGEIVDGRLERESGPVQEEIDRLLHG